MLVKDDPDSWRDSIGRNLDAYVAYGDEAFVDSIEKCFRKEAVLIDIPKWMRWILPWLPEVGYVLQGYRSPEHQDMDMSRDHTIYAIVAAKLAGREKFLEELKGLQWRLSSAATMRGMYLWWKSMTGSKWATPLFYLAKYAEMSVSLMWNKTLHYLGGFSEELHQNVWDAVYPMKVTEWQKKLRKIMVPTFAIHNFAWQLHVMKDGMLKRGLQKLTRQFVGDQNHFLLKLLGFDPIILPPPYNYENYKSMTGWRWSVTLNETNDRHTVIVQDPKLIEHNDLERDILIQIDNDTI
jgi:hypothetical protein